MLPEKKRNTNVGIGIGIVLQLSRLVLVRYGILQPDLGSLVWLIGVLFFIWGCMNYAEGKGASKWLGFLGVLSVIGLLILFFLPDRHKESR